MTTPEWISVFSVVVAVISAFRAWVYAGRAQRASERANEINEAHLHEVRAAMTRASKANLNASLERGDHDLQCTLVIRNEGGGVAREIGVTYLGWREFTANGDGRILPIDDLRPGHSMPLEVQLPLLRARRSLNPVQLRWMNEDGSQDTATVQA